MNQVNLDQLYVTTAMIKGNLKALELLSNDTQLMTLENSEDFKDLTANLKLADVTDKLEDYLNALEVTREKHKNPANSEIESALLDVFGGFNIFG